MFYEGPLNIDVFNLAAPGLSCGMQNLVPRPGIKPGPRAQWQRICLPMQEMQEMGVRSLNPPQEDPLE